MNKFIKLLIESIDDDNFFSDLGYDTEKEITFLVDDNLSLYDLIKDAKEGDTITYNKKSKVFSISNKNPIAICVCSELNSPDGRARFMALKDIKRLRYNPSEILTNIDKFSDLNVDLLYDKLELCGMENTKIIESQNHPLNDSILKENNKYDFPKNTFWYIPTAGELYLLEIAQGCTIGETIKFMFDDIDVPSKIPQEYMAKLPLDFYITSSFCTDKRYPMMREVDGSTTFLISYPLRLFLYIPD